MPRRRPARTRDDQKVDVGRKRFDVVDIPVWHIARPASRVRDAHLHRLDALGDRLADAAQADDAHRAAAELRREVRAAAQPFAAVHEPVGLDEAATRHQDQRDGDIGDVVGQHVGRVRHLDAALPAIFARHAVVTDAEHRDDLELRQCVEQMLRRHGSAALDQPTDLRADFPEQRRLVGRLCVVVATVVRLQRLIEKRRQRRRHQDVDVVHEGAWKMNCPGGDLTRFAQRGCAVGR